MYFKLIIIPGNSVYIKIKHLKKILLSVGPLNLIKLKFLRAFLRHDTYTMLVLVAQEALY